MPVKEIEHEIKDESEDDIEYESEDDLEYESIYFKYWFDGCATIDDILSNIERLKHNFEQWKREGHELTHTVDTGFCFIDKIYKPNSI